jgi:hypothetical protein
MFVAWKSMSDPEPVVDPIDQVIKQINSASTEIAAPEPDRKWFFKFSPIKVTDFPVQL